MNNVLAIDPGTFNSAYVLYQNGRLALKGIVLNPEIICLIKQEKIDIVSIEMIASYGMPVGKDVFETTVWIGRFIACALSADIKFVTRCYRKDIKMHLCNSLRAKDSNIRQALIDKWGKPGTKNNPNKFYNDATKKMAKDIWSALAVLDFTLSKSLYEMPLEK